MKQVEDDHSKTVILVYCVAYSFNVELVQNSRANNVSANNVRIAHESMQKNESGGLSLSLLLSKITIACDRL